MLRKVVLICVVVVVALAGCAKKDSGTNAVRASNEAAPVEGVEKVKPAPGTGNVQGKVLYNNAPVENIEVKLCETFSRFVSGCGGKTYTAKTDKDGDYVIANVEPKEYQGLMVRVFDTDSYIFATTGIAGISAAKYDVTADKTLFVTPTHIFKADLKTVNPKAGSTVTAQDLELQWEAYPDAAYYKFSLSPDNHLVTAPYTNERVEGTSFKVAKPVEKGSYRWKIEAYNRADKKLSETADDIKFTIN
ncbi:MAG TPA: carboxypeptidase-like regulatory domain-containing protein [Pyrinomonadaceae bacterium]|nr:carboxypeptidase-like regulatory domain-containing protein [Pyrinomonadaceae bacterium]